MGSLNYIAPEILEGSGHSFEVDLFSIGNPIQTSYLPFFKA